MKEKNNSILSKLLIASLVLIIILLVIIIVIVVKNKDNNERIINRDVALTKVLEDVNINKDVIKDLDIELKNKYNKDVYEVNFAYDGYEYEYYVDAISGEIYKAFKELDEEIPKEDSNTSSGQTNNQSSSQDNQKPSNSTTGSSSSSSSKRLGTDKALAKALEHAGLNKSDVRDIDVELEYKYQTEVYEVDFDYKNIEYQYYINSLTGEIVHYFQERD